MPSLVHVNLAANHLRGSAQLELGSDVSNSSSSLRTLNLSTNRFTNSFHPLGFVNLRVLDFSHNDLRSLPSRLEIPMTSDISTSPTVTSRRAPNPSRSSALWSTWTCRITPWKVLFRRTSLRSVA
ncbi:hypothetical protein H6P81_006429 [Aristolochia fimbriata]|uniref:Uncharacterized protein n=1 Tax=Aristolochia fimbriata TaxID=158543 RepID=A0AAV7EX95_ARIFI|nr:hypothetical protein H6P81_006429 [Aristolochia fimbriata]